MLSSMIGPASAVQPAAWLDTVCTLPDTYKRNATTTHEEQHKNTKETKGKTRAKDHVREKQSARISYPPNPIWRRSLPSCWKGKQVSKKKQRKTEIAKQGAICICVSSP